MLFSVSFVGHNDVIYLPTARCCWYCCFIDRTQDGAPERLTKAIYNVMSKKNENASLSATMKSIIMFVFVRTPAVTCLCCLPG